MTITITHAKVSSGTVNDAVEVDLADWNDDHTVSGAASLGEDNAFTGTQTVTPATGTTDQGLLITQTLPSSGTFSGPLNLNSITVTNPGTLTVPNVGWDSFGAITSLVSGLRVNYATTGASNTNNGALGVAQMITGSGEGYGAALGITVNGNSAGHNAWGAIAYATLWPGAVTRTLIGLDAEVGISGISGLLPAGIANYRIGVNANTQGPTQGTTLDAAFTASSIGSQVPPGPPGGVVAPWQHLLALATSIYGGPLQVIATTGDFFFSEDPITIAHFANLPNVTVTGNILDFPTMAIYGSNGSASFGVRNVGTLLTAGAVYSSCTSGGSAQIFGSADGLNGADGLLAKDSIGTNFMFAGVAEAGNTNVRFGQTTGNWGELVTSGATSNGLLLGTLTSDPVIIGTNNAARITISAGGAITIAPQTTFTVAPVFTDQSGSRTALGLGNVDNTSNATERAATATLTNKTVNLTSNTLTGTTAQFNTALSDGDFATLAGSESLTNKNLAGAGNTFPTFNQSTTGSAATLTTPRAIDGQSFDGSAAITVIAPGTHGATGKTTPVDADEMPLIDSAASNVLKKLTWANLKATLKTYFDTLYGSLATTNTWALAQTFTVGPVVGTQSQGDNSTKAASTAYADAAVAAKGTAVSVTPIWATGGTAPSLGNGTLTATVCRLGPGLLLASIKLTFGSTTTAGTGIWWFTLPAPYNGNATAFCSGGAHFADSGVQDYYGIAEMLTAQNLLYPLYSTGVGTATIISNTAPFTWGNGDYVDFSVLLIGP